MESLEEMDDQQIQFVADQLGLIGQNNREFKGITDSERLKCIKDNLELLIATLFNPILTMSKCFLEPVESKIPIIIYNVIEDYAADVNASVTFFNGQLNGPAIVVTVSRDNNLRFVLPETANTKNWPKQIIIFFDFVENKRHGPMAVFDEYFPENKGKLIDIFYWIEDLPVSEDVYREYLRQREEQLEKILSPELRKVTTGYLHEKYSPDFQRLAGVSNLPREIMELIQEFKG